MTGLREQSTEILVRSVFVFHSRQQTTNDLSDGNERQVVFFRHENGTSYCQAN